MRKWFVFLMLFPLLLIAAPSNAVTVGLNSFDEGGNKSFTGELLESSCAKIGVVLYHGRGASPTGPVVEELRNTLFRAGYTTLSIENPLPASGVANFSDYRTDATAVFNEAYARMRTAINYLQSLGIEQVVVAGFSLGSRFATAHVARGQIDELPILGLIGVGMYGNYEDPLNVSLTLDEVAVPVLDIYGDNDTSAASTATDRVNAYNSGSGLNYTQEPPFSCLSGKNCHQLEGLKGDDSMPLEITVNAWMQAVAPAAVLPNCGTQPPPATAPPQTIPDAAGSALDLYLLFSLPVLLSVFRLRRDQNI